MTISARERVAVFLLGFSAFLPLYAPQSVLPRMAAALGTSVAATGAVIGATTLAVAVAAPLAGPLTDRFGRKRAMLAALAALGPLTLALVLCRTLDQVLVARFAQGMALPALLTGAVAFITGRWPGAGSAAIMGVFVGGSAMGGFAGRFVAGMFGELFGWQAGFAALAALSLACLPVIHRWLPADAPQPDCRFSTHLGATWRHAKDSRILSAALFGATVLFAMTGTLSYVGFHLAQPPFDLGSAEIGLVFLVYPLGAAMAPMNGRLLRRLALRPAIVVAVAISLTGLGLLLIPAVAAVMAGICVFIIGIFLCQSLALGYVGRTARFSPGAAAGLYVCCFYLGGSLGAVIPGLIWPLYGWHGCVSVIAVVLCLGAMLSRLMSEAPNSLPRQA